MVGKYDKAIANRQAEYAARRQREIAQKIEDDRRREEERFRERAAEAVWKAEYAYEVLRAVMDDLRRGRPISKPALTNAFHKLEEIPAHVRNSLLPADVPLDKELRKDDPNRG